MYGNWGGEISEVNSHWAKATEIQSKFSKYNFDEASNGIRASPSICQKLQQNSVKE